MSKRWQSHRFNGIGPTKSAAGVRMLALDEQTVAFLREYLDAERARLGRDLTADEFLFTNAPGQLLRPEWLTRNFRRWVTKLDLPPVRLHDLRHGAASLAGMAGVDLKVIQHDTGHSSAVTTADTYQHVFGAHAHREVAKTAALLLATPRSDSRSAPPSTHIPPLWTKSAAGGADAPPKVSGRVHVGPCSRSSRSTSPAVASARSRSRCDVTHVYVSAVNA